MPRAWFRTPVIAIVIAIAAGGCVSNAGPESGSPASAVAASAAQASAPAAIQSARSTPTASAAATSVAVRDGEPWLLFNAFVGNDVKAAYLVRPDGTSVHRILDDVTGDIRALSWAPDGAHIVFALRDSTTDGTVWTAEADGSHAAAYYDGHRDGCPTVFYPVWSPDGSRLAFVCYQGAAGTPTKPNAALLEVLDVTSHRVKTLATTHWPDFLDNPSAWSPDGSTLAYDILHWDPTNTFIDGSRIATVPADGSRRPKELDAIGSLAAYPDWSLDGTRLVYNTRDLGNGPDDGPSNLFTMDADGADVRQLTKESSSADMRIGHPRWAPDGTRIWVTVLRGGNVTLGWVDPATGTLTELPVKGSRPEPRPLP